MKGIAIADRAASLAETRNLKMARSVHAYVRGNTARFYEWLGASPVAKQIAQGPPIWICGDCHLGNLGPVADAGKHIDIQIRDLDQSVIGNPALDLVRLGLSLETAARSSDLPGVATARMIEAMATGYALALRGAAEVPEPDAVRMVRKHAKRRRWRHLAVERIGDTDPDIPLGKRFWPIARAERKAIEALFESPRVREPALRLADLGEGGRIRVVDAAYWRKGCSSLGTLRYAILLGVRAPEARREIFALVDIKEAVAPLAPAVPGAKVPRDNAERVVAGARALAPYLGDRMIPARLLGKSVVIRELKPQDLKLEVAQFSRKEAVRAAGYLAYVVGRAHAGQLAPEARERWGEAFMRKSHGDLEAPSWLWRAIVDLAASHERGYLDHCRAYALAG